MQFNKPVTVTIPYDKTMLSENADPNSIGMVYFNGQDWITASGLVDTDKGTVTASLTSFPGISIAAILTMNIPTGPAAVVISAAVGVAIYWWWDNRPDALALGQAKNYVYPITPRSSILPTGRAFFPSRMVKGRLSALNPITRAMSTLIL